MIRMYLTKSLGVTTLNADDTMQYGLGDYLEINGLHVSYAMNSF